MKAKELDSWIEEMYAAGPGADTVARLVRHLKEDGEQVVTADRVQASCERLCEKGVLVRVGKRYAADPQWIADREADFQDSVRQMLKEHYQ
jgi:hypothetical protein